MSSSSSLSSCQSSPYFSNKELLAATVVALVTLTQNHPTTSEAVLKVFSEKGSNIAIDLSILKNRVIIDAVKYLAQEKVEIDKTEGKIKQLSLILESPMKVLKRNFASNEKQKWEKKLAEEKKILEKQKEEFENTNIIFIEVCELVNQNARKSHEKT